MISANLLGKCLLIGGAGAATGTGAYYIKETYFSNNKELKELAEKVGLSCLGKPTETSGVECKKIDGKNINLKQGEASPFEATNISGGKIRVYLKSKSEDNNKDFKFVIEDADVTTNDNAKKLEQFETYEIKEDSSSKKHHLTRTSEAKAEIKKALGLPAEGTECDLPDATTSEKTCNLDEGKLKAINFEGKTKEMALVNPASPGGSADTLSLQMKIATETEKSTFPHGYKFTLVSNRDITLGGDKSIKKDTNTEFKIKVTPASGGPKVLTLEKAWSVTELGKLVGLNCPEGDKKECTLNADKINVNNGSNKKYTGLTKGTNGDDKVVKYEEDVGDHNQGIKFFVDAAEDITLGGNGSGDEKKILKKDGGSNNQISYEIKKESSDTNWYLTKKTTTLSQ